MPLSYDFDDKHGETIVASITISIARSGAMKLEGAITDEVFAKSMLLAAMDTLNNYHNRKRIVAGEGVIIPSYDSPLAGSEEEKRLLYMRDRLSNAMAEDK